MFRCLIIACLSASARIARAPMATAPAALAPTAKAPRLVHPSPVATRANATCLPNGGCSSCLALGFLTVLSFPRFLQRLKYPPRYDATKRNAARASGIQNSRKPGGFSGITRVDKGLPKGPNIFLNCSERLLLQVEPLHEHTYIVTFRVGLYALVQTLQPIAHQLCFA